jgi:hypothetical protein
LPLISTSAGAARFAQSVLQLGGVDILVMF